MPNKNFAKNLGRPSSEMSNGRPPKDDKPLGINSLLDGGYDPEDDEEEPIPQTRTQITIPDTEDKNPSAAQKRLFRAAKELSDIPDAKTESDASKPTMKEQATGFGFGVESDEDEDEPANQSTPAPQIDLPDVPAVKRKDPPVVKAVEPDINDAENEASPAPAIASIPDVPDAPAHAKPVAKTEVKVEPPEVTPEIKAAENLPEIPEISKEMVQKVQPVVSPAQPSSPEEPKQINPEPKDEDKKEVSSFVYIPSKNKPEAKDEPSDQAESFDENAVPSALPGVPARRRGRPTAEEAQQYKRALENAEKEVTEVTQVTKMDYDAEKHVLDINDDRLTDDDVSSEVLKHVCRETMKWLKETYSSEIYTKDYMDRLLNDYIDGKCLCSQNPLLKSLVAEAIINAGDNAYLGSLTHLVLQYIHGK